MGDLVLAVDFGQTWCKAAYVDREGRLVAEGRTATRGLPAFGLTGDDRSRVWRALVETVRAATGSLGNAPRPDAIALSTRIGLGVFLDERGAPLAPRSGIPPTAGEEFMDEVYAPGRDWGADGLGTYAPILACRALWLRREHPELWARVRRVGAFHDLLLLGLTGEWATNPATGPGALAWPPAFGSVTGLPESALPRVRSFEGLVGGLTAAAADDLGLPTGTPVVAGYHDGAAATLGVGCVEPGDCCLTLGTSVALRVVSEGPPLGWFRYPTARDRFAWMRGLEQALAQLDAIASSLADAPAAEAHARLVGPAEGVAPGSNGLRMPPLPPLESDHRLDAIEAAREQGHDAATIYRAALEGLALGVAGVAERAREAGLAPRRYVATGGGTNSPLLLRLLGAALGSPIQIGEAEGGLRGAAAAAAVGAGWADDLAGWTTRGETTRGKVSSVSSVSKATEREVEIYAELSREHAPPPDPWEPRPYWRYLPT